MSLVGCGTPYALTTAYPEPISPALLAFVAREAARCAASGFYDEHTHFSHIPNIRDVVARMEGGNIMTCALGRHILAALDVLHTHDESVPGVKG